MLNIRLFDPTKISARWLPFADAASERLPLGRLLRLSLFQVTVGMALVLLTGTLNRVMIVELGMAASLVAAMVALPVLFAPARALIGHRSDNHRSYLGWRRVPYLWFGTLLQFGGFAIMPFALLVLSTDAGPSGVGQAAAALSFLMVGAGLHTTQTAGIALASDLADEETRPRVVALLYVMLLVGMVVAALLFGWALADFLGEAADIQVDPGGGRRYPTSSRHRGGGRSARVRGERPANDRPAHRSARDSGGVRRKQRSTPTRDGAIGTALLDAGDLLKT